MRSGNWADRAEISNPHRRRALRQIIKPVLIVSCGSFLGIYLWHSDCKWGQSGFWVFNVLYHDQQNGPTIGLQYGSIQGTDNGSCFWNSIRPPNEDTKETLSGHDWAFCSPHHTSSHFSARLASSYTVISNESNGCRTHGYQPPQTSVTN